MNEEYNIIKVSIITPVYNGERYIESCIKNVMGQNCKEAEHIIIDGGSTDKTVELIKCYENKVPHLRWSSEKDKGQSHAMNKGIKMARGKILGFLNVDDFYQENVFNKVLKLFEDLPVYSLVVGNCYYRNEAYEITGICKPKRLNLSDLLLGFSINPHPVNPSSYFYHKSLHQKIGGYDEDIHIAMDQDFIFRAVQVAHVTYVNEAWGNFYFHEGTKTVKDVQSGLIHSRDRRILLRYRKILPIFQRWRILIVYLFFNTIMPKCEKIAYYMRNVNQVQGMVRRKIKKNI